MKRKSRILCVHIGLMVILYITSSLLEIGIINGHKAFMILFIYISVSASTCYLSEEKKCDNKCEID